MSIRFTKIDFPGAAWTHANGVNRHGPLLRSVDIVGTYGDLSGTHGFLLSKGHYTALNVPSSLGNNTAAYGINGRGQIVGTYRNVLGETKGFLLDAGTYTGPPGACQPFDSSNTSASLYGINDAGSVVGSFVPPYLDTRGIVAANGLCIEYDEASGGKIEVFGINSTAQVVGYTESAQDKGAIVHGQFWPNFEGDPVTIDLPGATRTVLRGINDAGVICGYGDGEAFVQYQGTFTTFKFPGATSTQANGINNNDSLAAAGGFDVVGTYGMEIGLVHVHGFLATVSADHWLQVLVERVEAP